MNVWLRLFCVFWCPVHVATLGWADPPSKESYWLPIRSRIWSEMKHFTDALCFRGSTRKYEWMNLYIWWLMFCFFEKVLFIDW
jgi:hypothetical protein